jgi:hypothetical protein
MWSLVSFAPSQTLLGHAIQEGDVGGARSTHGGEEKNVQGFGKKT